MWAGSLHPLPRWCHQYQLSDWAQGEAGFGSKTVHHFQLRRWLRKKWLGAPEYLIEHCIKPICIVLIGAVCTAPGVWPTAWALITSRGPSQDRVIKNPVTNYTLWAYPSEQEGGIYAAVSVHIPSLPADTSEDSYQVPVIPPYYIKVHALLYSSAQNQKKCSV